MVSEPPRPSVVMSLVSCATPWNPATIGMAPLIERLLDAAGGHIDDASGPMSRVRDEAGLRTGVRASLRPQIMNGHGEHGHRDALAGGEQHVELAGRWQRRDLLGEIEEFIRGVAHGGDHDHHLVTGLLGIDDAPGHTLDALGVGHAGAAELLHNQGHKRRVYRRSTVPRATPEPRSSAPSQRDPTDMGRPESTRRARSTQGHRHSAPHDHGQVLGEVAQGPGAMFGIDVRDELYGGGPGVPLTTCSGPDDLQVRGSVHCCPLQDLRMEARDDVDQKAPRFRRTQAEAVAADVEQPLKGRGSRGYLPGFVSRHGGLGCAGSPGELGLRESSARARLSEEVCSVRHLHDSMPDQA